MALDSFIFGNIDKSICLELRANEFILKELIIFEELADDEGLVSQIDAKLISLICQSLNMSHHRDTSHGSTPELVILQSHLVVVFLEQSNCSLQVANSV